MFLAIDFSGYLVVSASYCALTGLIFGAEGLTVPETMTQGIPCLKLNIVL
jgi:hypothetical protein